MTFGIDDGEHERPGLLALAHGWVKWVALGLAGLAPFAYGSYPAWISGFVVAAYCVLGLGHVALCLCRGIDFFPVGRAVRLLSFALLLWLGALVCYDVFAGVEHGRTPALSVRELPYLFAFFSAAMFGASFGKRQSDAMRWIFFGVGVLLAALTFFQWLGWDIKTLKASGVDVANRPSGIFINPNRLAVMLSLCLAVGLSIFPGLIADAKTDPYGGSRRNLFKQCAVAVLLLTICSSLVLTLSRLTLICFGASLGIAAGIWTREQRRKRAQMEFWQLPLAERLQRGLLMGAPVLVIFAWAAWALSFGGQNLNARIYGSVEGLQRLDVVRLSPPLLIEHPWIGWGLGGFEAAFTGVQSAGLIGRWTRMHNDWLQVALECGWPAFVLVLLLTIFWLRDWWRKLRARGGVDASVSREWLEYLLPMTGCATALLCSIGDFPLRETSLAVVFFMLAGHLARSMPPAGGLAGSVGGKRPRLHFFQLGAAALPLAAGLSWSAFVSARNGLACANSPWRGQILFPPRAGTDLAAWERAIALDPGDPQLHYYLALAATQTPHAEAAVYELGLRHAEIAATLSPREYLIQWTAFTLAEKLERLELAAEFLQRAIALFPQDPRMHQDHGIFYLRRWVEPLQPGSFRRVEGLERALREFHWLLQHDLVSEEQLKNWMVGAGCTADEVSLLWQGDGPHEAVSRAKYNAEQGQWNIAEIELKLVHVPVEVPVDLPADLKGLAAGTWDNIWYYSLSGMVAFQKSEALDGIKRWTLALAAAPSQTLLEQRNLESYKQQASDFMVDQARTLPVEIVEKIALALATKLKEYPRFAYDLSLRLHVAGKFYSAEMLLRETAEKSEPLLRLRARNALLMGDEPAALEQAYRALQLADPGGDIKKWYSELILEVEARRRRRKEQGP